MLARPQTNPTMLSTNSRRAIPAEPNADAAPLCTCRGSSSSSFCRKHAEELRMLEERQRTAAHEADRLQTIVDEMVAEGAESYTRVRDVRKDERIVRLYLESLSQQIDAAVALKRRFFSEAGEDDTSDNIALLNERKSTVVAFLAELQARAEALELKTERQHAQEVAAAPEPAPEPAPAASHVDEPPAYPILDAPHPPCACTASSSDHRPDPGNGRVRWCTATKLRDGLPCMWSCVADQRFCRIHSASHGTVLVPHRFKEGVLEAQRMRVARGEGDRACRIGDVKSYIGKLDEMEGIVKEHQRLFSCRSPDSYSAILKDLKKRRISAGLLLGELSGRRDAKIAENEGQAETWTREFLAEVQEKDALERRKQVQDLLTGAIMGGASVWFGAPWVRRAIVDAVSSLVVGRPRDGTIEP